MRRRQSLIAYVATALVLCCSGAQAGVINWTYQATISTTYNGITSPDLLGIAGETLSFTLSFDDTKVWSESIGWLYYSPDAVLTAISGGHTLSLSSDAVAAYGDGCCAAIVDQYGSRSYADFLLDGNVTVMSGNGVSISNGPKVGENLILDHLPTSLETFTFFEYSNAAGMTARYNLISESISAVALPVPEPSTHYLVLAALAALAFRRRAAEHLPASRSHR